MINTINTISRL